VYDLEDEYFRNKSSNGSTYEQNSTKYFREQLVLDEKSVVSYY
jgi:hypothetical protein